jgi:hypothetical protein
MVPCVVDLGESFVAAAVAHDAVDDAAAGAALAEQTAVDENNFVDAVAALHDGDYSMMSGCKMLQIAGFQPKKS